MITSEASIASSDVAAHYNELDPFYREIWGEHVHHGYWEKGGESTPEAIEHLSMTLARWLKIEARDKIVDVGCGYGGTSRLLASTFEADVVGYTLSHAQEEFANARRSESAVQKGSVKIKCQDFLENGLRSSSVDAVISIECLEHIADKKAAFEEIARILKPGKRAAIALWAAHEDPGSVQTYLLETICSEGRMPSLPSGPEYVALMEEAGLKVIKEREISDQVKKTWYICAKRLAGKLASDARYRSFLFKGTSKEKVFALTLVRLMAAYEMKAMKYWIYSAEKPLTSGHRRKRPALTH